MSNYHADLVWAHSTQTDKAFTAMLYLAKIADRETGCGFIKPETLAEKIRIGTERYARLILDRLEAAGEISITETRGKTRYFQITLTALPHTAETAPDEAAAGSSDPPAGSPDPVEAGSGSHDPLTGSHDPQIGSHDPAFLLETDLNTELEPNTPPIIPPSMPKPGRKEGVFVSPPTPADQEFPFQNGRQSVHPPGECDRRTAAILAVCGLDGRIKKHRAKAETAAVSLAHLSADFIQGRYNPPGPDWPTASWNWYTHDFRGQKGQQPTVDQLVDTIALTPGRAAIDGVKAHANGSSPGTHPNDIEAMKARVAAKLQEVQNAPRLAQ